MACIPLIQLCKEDPKAAQVILGSVPGIERLIRIMMWSHTYDTETCMIQQGAKATLDASATPLEVTFQDVETVCDADGVKYAKVYLDIANNIIEYRPILGGAAVASIEGECICPDTTVPKTAGLGGTTVGFTDQTPVFPTEFDACAANFDILIPKGCFVKVELLGSGISGPSVMIINGDAIGGRWQETIEFASGVIQSIQLTVVEWLGNTPIADLPATTCEKPITGTITYSS